MIHPRQRRFAGLACALVVQALLALAASTTAQAPDSSPSAALPACSAPDFDITLQFGSEETTVKANNQAVKYAVIVVRKRYISGHPCIFEEHFVGPNFVYGSPVAGMGPFIVKVIPLPPFILNPGQAAQQTWRWRSNSPAADQPCIQPEWMGSPVLVAAPSLLKPVCSNIDISSWSVVDPLESLADAASPPDGQPFPFLLTANKSTYDAGERFFLRLSLDPASPIAAPAADCPKLYLRSRSPDGATRIDEMPPLAFKGCETQQSEHEPGDWQSGFDVDSGANSRWSGIGEHTLQVFVMNGSPQDKEIRFAASNPLRFQIADPTTLARRWGPLTKGLRADITFDKSEFRAGEEIPLHAAVENLSSDLPVFSVDPVWDPCGVVGIQIHDSRGNLLPGSAVFGSAPICMGHGRGPRLLEKGKIVSVEGRLGAFGGPQRPAGEYTIDLTWTPCVGKGIDPTSNDLTPLPRACVVTVKATASIRIVDNPKQAN
jgi:hypothetical protein